MADYQAVARIGEIPEGQGRSYVVNGRLVAVFNVRGEYRALLDTCPHMGASLAEGYVAGDVVYCPWHAWRFCVRDGLWVDSPKSALRTPTFDVRVTGDEICVLVPDAPAADNGEST